ncbi:MAG: FliH/SctL family protein, partial [Steroidobacter sp.]
MTHSRYELPSINGTAVQARRAGKTVQELEDVEQRAYEEAYAKGRAEGLAAVEREMRPQMQQLQSRVERLDAIINTLARPLHEMDAEVEDQLVQLSLTVARHLVRRELRIDPSQVIAIIRATVALLPASARDVRVHLH